MSSKFEWPWDVLELPEGQRSFKEIRRAYSIALKAMDPEADPQGFMRLREAFEYARSNHSSALLPRKARVDFTLEPAIVHEPISETQPTAISGADLENNPLVSIEELLAKTQSLIQHKQYKAAEWKTIFKALMDHDIEAFKQFEATIVETFSENENGINPISSTIMSADWGEQFESQMGWASDGLRFQHLYPQHGSVLSDYIRVLRIHGIISNISEIQKREKSIKKKDLLWLIIPSIIYLTFWYMKFGDIGFFLSTLLMITVFSIIIFFLIKIIIDLLSYITKYIFKILIFIKIPIKSYLRTSEIYWIQFKNIFYRKVSLLPASMPIKPLLILGMIITIQIIWSIDILLEQ